MKVKVKNKAGQNTYQKIRITNHKELDKEVVKVVVKANTDKTNSSTNRKEARITKTIRITIRGEGEDTITGSQIKAIR